MFQCVKDTVIYRKVIVAVHSGGTGYYGWVFYTQMLIMQSGPRETKVSKKGIESLLLGTCVVN